MGKLNISQPRAFEQHGIIGVQNTIMHDYKSNNVRYAMYVDFKISNLPYMLVRLNN
jgi:hypothetical protein